MWSQDLTRLHRCAQFITEKAGGSDVGVAEWTAVRDGDHWRLWGEKWFCSSVDAELAVLLARPEGACDGGRGLGLFLMPKMLEDGTRNAYRITRLKDKLGSRGMASGEIVFEGAVAYQLGDVDRGLKQMLEMVNSSRVSHLARAAGMMRRCLNEAVMAARHRSAFGRAVIDHPLNAAATGEADGADRTGAVGVVSCLVRISAGGCAGARGAADIDADL